MGIIGSKNLIVEVAQGELELSFLVYLSIGTEGNEDWRGGG